MFLIFYLRKLFISLYIKNYMQKLVTNKRIFFTSDQHFGHTNIIKLINRPFVDINSMNQQLITNWNDTITNDDIIFHLGDISFKNTKTIDILQQLNGEKYLIKGNHDHYRDVKKYEHLFKWVKDYYEFSTVVNDKEFKFILFHYPIAQWNMKSHSSVLIHGHSHGSYNPGGLSFDCGVDNPICDYRPIELQTILKYLKQI